MILNNRSTNRRHRSRSKRILADDCNIKQKTCETNTSKYNKAGIVKLAENCGVNVFNAKGKEKSRKELCQNIADLQTEEFENIFGEEPIPMTNIPEIPIINMPEIPIMSENIYTQDKLKSKYIPELLIIASNLGITKWGSKSIKGQKKQNIIDAILSATTIISQPVIQPIFEPVAEPDFVVIEEPEPNIFSPQNMVNKKDLMMKTKKGLLEDAETYGIEKWLDKKISRHNKPEIVDAILDYLNRQNRPLNIPSSPLISSTSKPRDMLSLISQKRRELINKLKIKQGEQCNPLNGINCSGDNVCDVSKTPNVCISNEEAQYRQGKRENQMMLFKGKKIFGTKKSLNIFKDIADTFVEDMEDFEIGGAEEYKEEIPLSVMSSALSNTNILEAREIVCNICGYTKNPVGVECLLCNSNLSNNELSNLLLPEGTEILEQDSLLPEGTEITEMSNIEDILNEIQNKEDTTLKDIKGLDEAKKKVLYCLGLLN